MMFFIVDVVVDDGFYGVISWFLEDVIP